ncbi:MAG: hypothetical protein LUI05_03820 [Oscillospiraceae bacterium]|nr:hypothetical protein [Oscillospiraceae bacterium]
MKSNIEYQNSNSTEPYFNSELKKQIKAAKNYKRNVNIYSKISLAVFAAAVLAVSVCMVFMERPTVSEIEKRNLTEKPVFSIESFFSGEYTSGFSQYFSDTVPFREKLVGISAYLKKAKGISAPVFYGSVEVVADDDGTPIESEELTVTSVISSVVTDENSETSIVSETVTAASETAASETDSEELNIADFSNNGIVVDGVKMYGESAGIMLFGGNKTQGKRYADIINEYHEALGESVNIWDMVVPTSAEFYLPSRFSKYSSSEKDAIDYIYSSLADGVTGIDAYSAIAEHTDEYIYFRTDHHWTPLGAYYAYTAFMDTLGMEYAPIDDYTEKVKTGFVGSLYGYTNDVTLLNSPDEFHYFLPNNVEYTVTNYNYATLAPSGTGALFHEYVEGSNCYGMFLGADALHLKVSTNVKNGRKIVVFKESYGNAFIPYLVNNFEEIYVIDIRYFGANAVDYIKRIGATDVLFINNCFAANTSSLISGIERLYESDMGTITTTIATEEETEISSVTSGQTAPASENAAKSQETAVISSKATESASTASTPAVGEAAQTTTARGTQ